MNDESKRMTDNTTASEQESPEPSSENDYDLPVELFAGIVILIMGALVLITPVFSDMPADLVWDPILINGISGTIYLLVGAYFIRQAGYF